MIRGGITGNDGASGGFLGWFFWLFLPHCIPDVSASGLLSLLWLLGFVWKLISLSKGDGRRG